MQIAIPQERCESIYFSLLQANPCLCSYLDFVTLELGELLNN